MKIAPTSMMLLVALSFSLAGCAVDSTDPDGETDGTSLVSEGDSDESVGEAASELTVVELCQSPLVCFQWTYSNGVLTCTVVGHPPDSLMVVKNYCDGLCNHLVQSCAPKAPGTCTLMSGQVLSCPSSTTG